MFWIPRYSRVLIETTSKYEENEEGNMMILSPLLKAGEVIYEQSQTTLLRAGNGGNYDLPSLGTRNMDTNNADVSVDFVESTSVQNSVQSMKTIIPSNTTEYSSCQLTNSIGMRQVDNRQYRSFRYMFHSVPIGGSLMAEHNSMEDDQADDFDYDDDDDAPFSAKYAVCEFVIDQFSFHFPHTMQQLYRCWSWWRSHQDAIPVLIFPHAKLPQNKFLIGFVSSLQDIIGLEVYTPDQIHEIGLFVDENGAYSLRPDTFETMPPLLTLVQPRFPPNLVDLKNLFGMEDPTCTYFSFHSIDDSRDLRDRIVYNLFNDTYKDFESGATKRQEIDDNFSAAAVGLQGEVVNEMSVEKDTEIQDGVLRSPRIAILNRHRKRELQNAHEVAQKLKDELSQIANVKDIEVVYFNESTTFRDQIQLFSSTDILISPHGAQLTGIPFMPNCAEIFEIFPAGYYLPYYFGSLASASGLQHAFTSSTSSSVNWKDESIRGMKDRKSRQSVRNTPICISPDTIVDAVRDLVTSWKKCHSKK
jgi:Glycosyltransferase 61